MKSALFIAVLLTRSAGAVAQTETTCPWLTIGTAARMLGGDVTMTAHSTSNWDGSCAFIRTIAATSQTLEILVGRDNTHPCPEGSQPVAALGNEAVHCRRKTAKGEPQDTIAGRVRDVFFVVSITGASSELPSSPESQRFDPNAASPLERVAEQVSGSLY
jgi:hypothetical protein